MLATSLVLLLAGAGALATNKPTAFDGGDDLLKYVTQPSLRPPRFNITYQDLDRVAPGYWFVAPYEKLNGENPGKTLELCQIGPHIYDNHGELVWSGACRFFNRNAYDLKVVQFKDKPHLSMILGDRKNIGRESKGMGLLLDGNYTRAGDVVPEEDIRKFNMHGWSVIDNGKHALVIAGTKPVNVTIPPEKPGDVEGTAKFFNNGFQEIDFETKKVLFDWRSLDHLNVTETKWGSRRRLLAHPKVPLDWFHLNSIAKFENGDYLMSARHVDCVYRISKDDGHVVWRLGGKYSDFELDGFNFSRQHDARLHGENGNKTTLSLFNNASDGMMKTSKASQGLIVELDTGVTPFKAKLLKRYVRPDGKLANLRGNFQVLENGNGFTCWSENSHITEFSEDGDVVLDAQFAARRFVTYRAFKFEWVGHPTDPIAVKSFAYGASLDDPITLASYVSWNGATEVATWEFHGRNHPAEEYVLIGREVKKGFETTLMSGGLYRNVKVIALDKNGNHLGESEEVYTEIPSTWAGDPHAEGFTGGLKKFYRDNQALSQSAMGFLCFMAGMAVTLGILFLRKRRATARRPWTYEKVPGQDHDPMESSSSIR